MSRPAAEGPAAADFLRACQHQPVDRTPVWLMRQAGRYLPEYRKLRERYPILELIGAPELAAEVTLQPLVRFDLDAAIIFADILPPIAAMGLDLAFAKGEGPVISNPVRTAADVSALRTPDPREALASTLEAIRIVRRELAGREPGVPLIGFAGGPFTLATYAIEGGSSRQFTLTKRFMLEQPDAWQRLMNALADLVADFLVAQIEAGAQAVQLFDSWAGALGAEDYRQHVLPYSQRVLETVNATGVPSIHFATGTAGILELFAAAGSTVVGIDWRISLQEARRRLPAAQALQGNLDPALLFAPRDELARRVSAVLQAGAGGSGYVFNLGHGVLPGTPPEAVAQVVELVHRFDARAAAATEAASGRAPA